MSEHFDQEPRTIFVYYFAYMTSRFTINYTVPKKWQGSVDGIQAFKVMTSAFILTVVLCLIKSIIAKLQNKPVNMQYDVLSALVTASCVATGSFFGAWRTGIMVSGFFSILLAVLVPPHMIRLVSGLMGGLAASADTAAIVATIAGVHIAPVSVICGMCVGVVMSCVATIITYFIYQLFGYSIAYLFFYLGL